jgi:hypothetical protein
VTHAHITTLVIPPFNKWSPNDHPSRFYLFIFGMKTTHVNMIYVNEVGIATENENHFLIAPSFYFIYLFYCCAGGTLWCL